MYLGLWGAALTHAAQKVFLAIPSYLRYDKVE